MLCDPFLPLGCLLDLPPKELFWLESTFLRKFFSSKSPMRLSGHVHLKFIYGLLVAVTLTVGTWETHVAAAKTHTHQRTAFEAISLREAMSLYRAGEMD